MGSYCILTKPIFLTVQKFRDLKQHFYAEGHEFLGFNYKFYKQWLEERFDCFLLPPSHRDSKNVVFRISPKSGANSEYLTLLILSVT
jgi:hypothetical protein